MEQAPQGLTIPTTACKFHREVAVRLNFHSLETPPTEIPSLSDAPRAIRVAICADVLISWAGGMDILVHVARSMKAAKPKNDLILLVPDSAPGRVRLAWDTFRYAIKNAAKAALGRSRIKQSAHDNRRRCVAELIGRMREAHPSLEVRHAAGLDNGLAQAAADLQLDAVILAMRTPTPRPGCALIGYVTDYQHRYLPHLFSAKECTERDVLFGQLVTSSDAMVMNARAVADDMRRFTPEPLPPLHVLPFCPALNADWLGDRPELLSVYAISGPYFIVCNQFWMHKDHLTAFRAFAEVAQRHPNVSLICTGGTADGRDPTYFGRLEAEVAKLDLGSRLRLLGHIPKRDQIELLKNAVALVQPTLFEGGPGGGSTYEAVALGQRVLLSDLSVNREINDGDVRFFPPGDHVSLSKLMKVALEEEPIKSTPEELVSKSNARLKRCGEAIWASVTAAIARSQNR
jgi:glycosyltransferase involved in cell wall biosynthesis